MPIAHDEPAGAASTVLMMNSVDPTRSALVTTSWRALGVHQHLDAGDPLAHLVDDFAVNRPCTEQCPFHRIIRASRSCSGGQAAVGLVRVPHDAVLEASCPSSRTAVLRPRCWSGRNSTFASRFCSNAHSSATWAFDDVQTAPPCRPQNALMSAEEFMYVTGTTDVGDAGVLERVPGVLDLRAGRPCRPSSSRRPGRAGSPAAAGAVRMSADSAMKCTPQNTMYSASGRPAASRASLKESPVTSANSITSSRW